jgi:16S rRNA (cytidine1402-2'-O)-methyltransferase
MSKLTLVPTPIGNLADMTYRAIEVLKSVDVILAEDTRTSGRLMQHYEIPTHMRPFHSHNEHRVVERLLNEMHTGTEMALISDAGTPGISDPGFLLARACFEAEIPVECLPGATAFVPALVLSGMALDRFMYEGFLPHKKGRQTRIKGIAESENTVVLYESPHRVLKLIDQLAEFCGEERRITTSREISKLHEETFRGTLAEARIHFNEKAPRGEFVVVIEGLSAAQKSKR